jgi:hypothetical protein
MKPDGGETSIPHVHARLFQVKPQLLREIRRNEKMLAF